MVEPQHFRGSTFFCIQNNSAYLYVLIFF